MKDSWTNDGLFHHYGKAYGLDGKCRTVVVPENIDECLRDGVQTAVTSSDDTLDTPRQNVTDNLPICEVCGNPVPGKRVDRQYCSPKCRKQASRGRQLELARVG